MGEVGSSSGWVMAWWVSVPLGGGAMVTSCLNFSWGSAELLEHLHRP